MNSPGSCRTPLELASVGRRPRRLSQAVGSRWSWWLAGICVAAAVAAGCAGDPEAARAAYVASGDAYLKAGKTDEAIIEYRNAVQKDARSGETRLKLADAYLQVDDIPNASREYVRAADLMPERLDLQIKAGSFMLLFGRFEDAKTRAEQILAANPSNVDAQILLGNAMAGLKDMDGAVSEIEQAIKMDPDDPRGYSSLGAFQSSRGNRAAAEAALKKALELAPQSAAAELALGNFYWSTESRAKAEQHIRAALALDPKSILANRAMALLFVSSGRAQEAEPFLKASVDISHGPSERMALADYYVLTQRPQQAEAIFSELSSDKAVGSAAKLRLSAMAFERKDLTTARAELQDVLKAEPNNPRALLLDARFLMSERRFDEALARSDAAVKADNRLADAHYVRGLLLLARADTGGATNEFRETLRLNPRAAAAQAQLARIYFMQGQTDVSRQFAENAVTNDPGNAEMRLMLVRALAAEGSLPRAETEMNALLASQPNSPAVQAGMGTLMLMKRDPEAARRYYERALALQPRDAEALNGLIAIDIALKDMPRARGRIDEALKVSPRDITLLLLAGRTYAAAGDLAKTEELLKQALDLDPSNLLAYQLLGSLYLSQQKLEQARLQFEAMTAKQSNATVAATMAAIILEAQHKSGEAKARYQQILQKDPGAAVAANNLAWIMVQSGDENLDVALQYAQTARAKLPTRPEVNDTLGWIYLKKNMLPQAISALQESVNRDVKNPIYHLHLGLAYVASGDTAKARASLEQSLRLKADFSGADAARKALAEL